MTPVKSGTALVTGASAGIGAEFCRQLAPRCELIIATGRRIGKLQDLAAELAPQVEVRAVDGDLAEADGRKRLLQIIEEHGPLDYLVNNAGLGTLGLFAETDIEAQQLQVDLHITATLALTRVALPGMIAQGRGHIINLSSLGAFYAFPRGMVYSATKAFLNVFSEGLQAEVADHGIRVQSLCPGYTYTEFHDRAPIADAGFTRDQVPAESWMAASEVVAMSLAALEENKVIVLPGEHNLAAAKAALGEQLQRLDQ